MQVGTGVIVLLGWLALAGAFAGQPVPDAAAQAAARPAAEMGEGEVAEVLRGRWVSVNGPEAELVLTVDGAGIQGRASVPGSRVDTRPTLRGSFAGTDVAIELSSGFDLKLKLTGATRADYRLVGRTAGHGMNFESSFRKP